MDKYFYFDDIFEDYTKYSLKISKSLYLKSGLYPIIDQGKEEIAGYSDKNINIFDKIPVIIFGDHTRIFKYVDYPFFLGADGVKILKNTSSLFSDKYLYYSLKNFNIPNTGYNRHFKWLKDFKIKYISLAKQERITSLIEKIEFFILKKKKQLEYLKELNKSLFTRMFGNPFYSNKIKEDNRSFLKDIAIINPTKKEIEYIENNLEISFVTMADISENGEINVNNIKKLEDVKNNFTFFKEGDVLFAKITPCMENGKGGVAKNLKNNIGFGTTEIHIIRPIRNITNSQWLYHLTKLPLFRKDAEIHMTGSAGQKRVPTTYLSNFKIKVPPIELQNKFAERVEKIEKLSFEIEKSIKEAENLYNILIIKYFD